MTNAQRTDWFQAGFQKSDPVRSGEYEISYAATQGSPIVFLGCLGRFDVKAKAWSAELKLGTPVYWRGLARPYRVKLLEEQRELPLRAVRVQLKE